MSNPINTLKDLATAIQEKAAADTDAANRAYVESDSLMSMGQELPHRDNETILRNVEHLLGKSRRFSSKAVQADYEALDKLVSRIISRRQRSAAAKINKLKHVIE